LNGNIHIATSALYELKNLRYLDADFENVVINGAEGAGQLPRTLVLLRYRSLRMFNFDYQAQLAVVEIAYVESLPSSMDSYQFSESSRF
jgi:hypothetical protein